MKLVLFVGPTGSGKSTIINNMLKSNENYKYVVSDTTRNKRINERDGSPYNFISRELFTDGIEKDKYIEYEEIHGNFYGVSNKIISDIFESSNDYLYFKDIGVIGAAYLKELYGDDVIFIFIDVENDSEITKRLKNRGDSKEDIIKRLERVEYERSYKDKADLFLINENIDDCLDEINHFLLV